MCLSISYSYYFWKTVTGLKFEEGKGRGVIAPMNFKQRDVEVSWQTFLSVPLENPAIYPSPTEFFFALPSYGTNDLFWAQYGMDF